MEHRPITPKFSPWFVATVELYVCSFDRLYNYMMVDQLQWNAGRGHGVVNAMGSVRTLRWSRFEQVQLGDDV
jgi:hypothetical protein